MNADQILHQTEKLILDFEKLLKNTKLQTPYATTIESLKNELTAPCVLAIAGKVKAGKSSILNALLGVDLAMTGTTETTATINVFKGGSPVEPSRPILCQYLDGKRDWHPKSYLDELQGTSEKALEETSKIDKLIFHIPDNPILNDITIVDTPGIGAQVGGDGDSHQEQTDAYFKLRERHKNDTKSLSHSADAIIYLFDTVPTALDKDFLDALHNGGSGLTAFNGVGVLSKIDRDLTMVGNIPKFKTEFERQLFTILPTSAALYRFIPNLENAIIIKNQLQNGFASEGAFEQGIMSEKAFLHPRLPKCTLSIEERKEILRLFKKGGPKYGDNGSNNVDFQWSTFQIIAKRLYHAHDVAKELLNLQELSGIDSLRRYISDHFFSRTRLLRCHKILTELKSLVSSITYSRSFLESQELSLLKDSCLESCKSLPPKVRDLIERLVDQHIPSPKEVKQTAIRLSKLKNSIDEIKISLTNINNSIVVFQRIKAEKSQFSDDEISELGRLLSGQDMEIDILNRLKYWSAVYNSSKPNSLRQNAAATAKSIYQKKLK